MATPAERFWPKVNKTDECWLWTGSVTGQGKYGYFYVSGSGKDKYATTAHRWAYVSEIGPIPDGFEIDHLCRNRLCVKPAHLQAVTHAENHRRRGGIKTGPYNVGDTCRHGHSRTPENTGHKGGYRFCRPCARAVQARGVEKKRTQ